MKQTFNIVTLGCKVNQYESQAIRESFLVGGWKESGRTSAAVYIINTCTVTHQADRESRRLIRQALRANSGAKIFVTGCFVEKDAGQIQQISPKIKIVANAQKYNIFNLLIKQGAFSAVSADSALKDNFASTISGFKGHQRAFVKIQDGCNNFCSYCKVPFVRGRSRSRKLSQIEQEVSCLLEQGFKEIVLTGVCLGSYRYKKLSLADVLVKLNALTGNFRIRLSSIEPQLISPRLIETLILPRLCPHLHLPLQSADDTILKKMNRSYSGKDFVRLVKKIRTKIPDVGITTDVLVGFPGETQANFSNTARYLKQILPLRTHIFPFSPRAETAAFNLPGRISPELIKQRIAQLRQVADSCSYDFRKRFLKKELTVLVEQRPRRSSGFYYGYAQNYIRVSLKGANSRDQNQLVKARVEEVNMQETVAMKTGETSS